MPRVRLCLSVRSCGRLPARTRSCTCPLPTTSLPRSVSARTRTRNATPRVLPQCCCPCSSLWLSCFGFVSGLLEWRRRHAFLTPMTLSCTLFRTSPSSTRSSACSRARWGLLPCSPPLCLISSPSSLPGPRIPTLPASRALSLLLLFAPFPCLSLQSLSPLSFSFAYSRFSVWSLSSQLSLLFAIAQEVSYTAADVVPPTLIADVKDIGCKVPS